MHGSPLSLSAAEHVDNDDWINTIEDLLALVNYNEDRERVLYASHYLGGTATAWWDGFKVMQGDCVITWADLKQGLCIAHVPSRIMLSRS
ncbi:putative SDCCAG3 family protein-like [Hordeum vulgare]|nr:putative SDCCAG3 family protein-like [Hordeum vulgare]